MSLSRKLHTNNHGQVRMLFTARRIVSRSFWDRSDHENRLEKDIERCPELKKRAKSVLEAVQKRWTALGRLPLPRHLYQAAACSRRSSHATGDHDERGGAMGGAERSVGDNFNWTFRTSEFFCDRLVLEELFKVEQRDSSAPVQRRD